jgi:hypothetical protein
MQKSSITGHNSFFKQKDEYVYRGSGISAQRRGRQRAELLERDAVSPAPLDSKTKPSRRAANSRWQIYRLFLLPHRLIPSSFSAHITSGFLSHVRQLAVCVLLVLLKLRPWRWQRYIPSKQWTSNRLPFVTTHEMESVAHKILLRSGWTAYPVWRILHISSTLNRSAIFRLYFYYQACNLSILS